MRLHHNLKCHRVVVAALLAPLVSTISSFIPPILCYLPIRFLRSVTRAPLPIASIAHRFIPHPFHPPCTSVSITANSSIATLPGDPDLWIAKKSAKGDIYLRFPDKLRALALDAKLAGYHRPPPAHPPLPLRGASSALGGLTPSTFHLH
jgi:hypothetical protein